MQRIAFSDASELSCAIEALLAECPVALYYGLDTVAPYPGFQRHDGYEFYYVWRGTGTYIAGDDSYPIGPGTLVPIRPKTPHRVVQTDISQPVCRHVLLLREDFYRQERLSDVFPDLRDERRTRLPVIVPEEERERVEWLFCGARDELRAKAVGYEHALAGSVRMLLALFRRYALIAEQPSVAVESDSGLPPEIVYALQHVSSNFQAPLSLKELASKVHMNPSYISTLFHRHTGYTLRQFVAMKRIGHAKTLLLETALPIQAIADESGYKDASHFIRVFKHACGTTPQAYRNGLI